VVGISRYKHADPLRYAASDAARFADLLGTRYGFSRNSMRLLARTPSNALVTRAQFESALEKALAGAKRDTTLVVYFAGHGARARGRDWLIPADGRETDVAGTCIDLPGLLRRLAQRAPERALVFLDVCRDPVSPTLADPGPLGDPSNPGEAPPGLAVFYSCRPGQLSRESHRREPLGGGVFTHFLLHGLTAPGTVTPESLQRHLESTVPEYVDRHYFTPQRPVLQSAIGRFTLRSGPNSPPPRRK